MPYRKWLKNVKKVSTAHRHDDRLRIRPADGKVPVDCGQPPLLVLSQQLGELHLRFEGRPTVLEGLEGGAEEERVAWNTRKDEMFNLGSLCFHTLYYLLKYWFLEKKLLLP